MSPLRQLLSLGKKYWLYLILSFFASALIGYCTMYNAKILAMLTDDVLVVPEGANQAEYLKTQMKSLYIVIFAAIAVTFGKGLGTFLQTYFMSFVSQKIIIQLKIRCFRHLQDLPLSFFARYRTGDLVSRLNGDMVIIEQMLQTLTRIMPDPFVILILVTHMFSIDWQLSLFIFVFVPVLGGLVRWLSARLRRAGKLLQDKVGDISALIQESVIGIKIIKAFRMEEARLDFFERECEENFRFSMKSVKYNALNSPVVELADAAGVALMIYFGSLAVIENRLSPGDLIGFLTALGLLFHPLKKLTNGNAFIQQSQGAVVRVFEILQEEIESNEGDSLPDSPGNKIRFENLSFSFDDKKKVLKDINLEVEEGEVVALVGPSGGGKTTLVSLLPRFNEWKEGKIFLGDREIRDYKLKDFRKLFGMVPQETILFKGSIEDNIRFAKPEATIEEIMEACKAANAHNFIESMEGGYKAQISEMGVGLSGGQRQRIAIARAILKDPKILILDEATSALDNESEKIVQDALDKLMVNRTTFVIAHRISTVVNADKIVVLNQGKIEAVGKHQDLLVSCELYAKLCQGKDLGGSQ